jgi:hypothetical protein
LVLIISACNKATFSDTDRVIARAYDEYLYLSDIAELVPSGSDAADSIIFVQNYVNNWVKNQILLYQAEKNLTTDQKDFSKQLEDYRNSLIIFAYESELIRQKLDTIVSDEEIEDYYNRYSGNFKLNENIVRLVFAKIYKSSKFRDKIRELVKSDIESDRDSLEYYCIRYAEDYGLIDQDWITFEEMLKKVPVQVENAEVFLSGNTYVEFNRDSTWYYAHILDYGLRDEISPLSVEEKNIRSIILNKRKKQLISRMHQEMYNLAMTGHDFEIF